MGEVHRGGYALAAAGLVLSLTSLPTQAAPVGDPAAGARVFLQCRACHQIGPGAQNFVGPDLNGVVGRKAGTEPGFDYSQANKTSGLTWDVPTLTKYLRNPQKVVPGTRMTFAGLKNPKDVANVIAYLEQFGPNGQKKK